MAAYEWMAERGLAETAAYEGMAERGPVYEVMADDVGTMFCVGTVAGFAYHLMKGMSCSRRSFYVWRSLKLAWHRAPQVGGVCGAFAAASDAVQVADLRIRGKDDVYNTLLSNALAAAALRAKHGFRSASISALFVGTGVTALMYWFQLVRKRQDEQQLTQASR